MKQKVIGTKGYISVTEKDKAMALKESFQGEVVDVPVKFPRELGAEHPFEFEDAEKVLKHVGLINGAVNKIANKIVGEFTIKSDDPKIKTAIDTLIKETDLKIVTKQWVKEGLSKGNGFMELDVQTPQVKVNNANYMYVKRNSKGEVKEYNQFLGNLNNFNPGSRKLTPFKPEKIAHLKINAIAGEPYGYGMIIPNERVIENIVQMEQDYHKLIKRKAGAPIHAKLGQPGETVASESLDEMSDKLKYMTNRTEWVTDGNCEFKVIDFGEIGKNLTDALTYDFRMLIAGLEIPEVSFGSGQLNEGIAQTQKEELQEMISSIQDEVETILERQIFKPYLEYQGLSGDIEFVWNLPSEAEINARIEKITALLGNMNITENMARMLQLELARLLHIEDAEEYLLAPEVGADEEESDMDKAVKQAGIDNTVAKTEKQSPERKKEESLKQPEIPGEKLNASDTITIKESDLILSGDIGVREFCNLQEIKGFNYSEYLISILKRIKTDKFEELRALTEKDVSDGLLDEDQIKKLRLILRDGFKRNRTIRQIEKEIKDSLDLKDRVAINGSVIPAESRPNMIARTETIRLANAGLLDNYKENGVDKVRWLAALSDRTCPECESMNSQVFTLQESYGQIPLHPNCRCTWVSI